MAARSPAGDEHPADADRVAQAVDVEARRPAFPRACASSATMPSPSNRDGISTTAARAYSRFNAVAVERAQVLDAPAARLRGSPHVRLEAAAPDQDAVHPRVRCGERLQHRDRVERALLPLHPADEEHAPVLVLDAGKVDRVDAVGEHLDA